MTPVSLSSLGNSELLDSTRALLDRSNVVEAELLVHLSEVETRGLHLERAFASMFEFCVEELRMSEGVAYNRIYVARLARSFPAVLECVRTGRVHLSGVRVLGPHLTDANCIELLAEATGKSKRQLEVFVTRFAPKAAVPTSIRTITSRPAPAMTQELVASASPNCLPSSTADVLAPTPSPARSRIEPLTPATSKMTLTINASLREKIEEAQGLMRHRASGGDLGVIIEDALDLLIEKVKKERFATGRKPRRAAADPIPGEGTEGSPHVTRHIPDAIKRAVYERDRGRCTFVSKDGRQCAETGGLQFDHLDGFAITREHSVERIALKCGPHNRHAAKKEYRPAKMAAVKNSLSATRPGTGENERLF